MNWLAHLYLSEQNIDYQLGNLLADPLKGKAWEGANSSFLHGILMHKSIDAYTDKHAVVLQSKSRLGKRGYLKGVVIDIVYDYFLSKHWNDFATLPKDDFLQHFYDEAARIAATYPKQTRVFVNNLIKSDKLNKYTHFSELEHTFVRIDARLSKTLKRKESTLAYLPIVIQECKKLETDFLHFFPTLRNHVKQNLDSRYLMHWKDPV